MATYEDSLVSQFDAKYKANGYAVTVRRCTAADQKKIAMSNPKDLYFWLEVEGAAPIFIEGFHKSFPTCPDWASGLGVFVSSSKEVLIAAEINSPPVNIEGGTLGRKH